MMSLPDIQAWIRTTIQSVQQPPAPTSFHLFPQLPREIQRMIWRHAFHLAACSKPYGVYVAWIGPNHQKLKQRYTNLNLLPLGTPQYEPECWGQKATITGQSIPNGSICLEGDVLGQVEEKLDDMDDALIAADDDVVPDTMNDFTGEPEGEASFSQHVVVLFPDTELQGLLHCCRLSRHDVLEAFRNWVGLLLKEARNPLDLEGKPKEWDARQEDVKNFGEEVLKVFNYLLRKQRMSLGGTEA